MRYRREQFEGTGAESGGEPGFEGIPGNAGGPEVPGPVGPGRKKRRGVALLPAMFTLGNCLCGFVSLSYAARAGDTQPSTTFDQDFAIAGYFIFVAMIFDMFDGFVARMTRSASDFGAELDSLADMVSFGVAPAFLSIRLIGDLLQPVFPAGEVREAFLYLPGPFSDDNWLRLFWIIGAIYVSCTALRLARFNVLNKSDILSHMNFRGMPSPAAAAVVAASVIFFETLNAPKHMFVFNVSPAVQAFLKTVFPYVLPSVLLVAALLMVSRFAYAHLVNRFLRGRKKFRHVVGFFLFVMVVAWQPAISVLVGIYLYALSAPVTWAFKRITRRGAAGAKGGLAAGGVGPLSTRSTKS